MNCDIVSLNEIYLFDDNGIVLIEFGYKWKGFNKKNLYIKVLKGLGGVGLLIKKLDFWDLWSDCSRLVVWGYFWCDV